MVTELGLGQPWVQYPRSRRMLWSSDHGSRRTGQLLQFSYLDAFV